MRKEADTLFGPRNFILLLAILIVISFWKVISLQETFFYRDFSTFAYPLAFYHRTAFWRGEWPLWNPLNNCGLPFLAQWNTMTLYPFSIFYLLFPLSWSLGIFCLLHLFLGGVGMYFLARRWTNSNLAAALAGVAFSFSGLALNSLMWTNNIAVIGWMPWVVCTAERAWETGGTAVVVAALIGAMQMLAGGPEMILCTWMLIGVLWLLSLFRRVAPLRSLFCRFFCLLALVTALAAAQLLPFLDLLTHSQRDPQFGGSDWSMPGWGWANLLVPAFFNFPAAQGVFFQYGQYWTSSYYLGVVVLGLALLALWVQREAKVCLLAIVFCASFILALGSQTWFYRGLERLVPLGFMRYPIKMVTLGVFVAPLLAAFAARCLFSEENPKHAERRRAALWVTLAFLLLIGLIVGFAWRYPQYPPPYNQWAATWKSGLTRMLFLIGFAAAAYAYQKFRNRPGHSLAALAMVLMVWLDLITHAPNQNPTVSRWVYEPNLVRAKIELAVQPQEGQSRAFSSPVAETQFDASRGDNPAYDVLQKRLILLHNCNLLDLYPKVNGFYSLYPKASAEVISLFYQGKTSELDPLRKFLGVSMVGNSTNPLAWLPTPSFLPLVTAGQASRFGDAGAVLRGLAQKDFDPGSVVYLPETMKSEIRPTQKATAKILSIRFEAQKVEATVQAKSDSLVVISQSYYHWWKAFVDGKPVPLWPANHAFQALALPPGVHQVKLIYHDQFFIGGLILSGLAFTGCLLALLVSRRRHGQNGNSSGSRAAAGPGGNAALLLN